MTAHWQFAYGPETFKQCAAKQVGVTGSVVGIDINQGILEVANSVTSQEIVIEWHEVNIERIPFPENSFDIVLCQMGLQFIPDKLAALKEIHRVLRNGGRFIFNLPRPTPQLFAYMQEAFEKTIHDKFEFLNQVFSLHY